MKITILVDDQQKTNLIPEFGLSLLIQDKDREFLFDTGAGKALLPNLSYLGIK